MLGGSAAWTHPLRLKLKIFEPAPQPISASVLPQPAAVEPVEYDEDGRLYVFRYRTAAPTAYTIERDRLFAYVKRRRLPTEADRAFRRDVKNSANFFEDVRDLQTHSDIDVQANRLRW